MMMVGIHVPTKACSQHVESNIILPTQRHTMAMT